MIPSKIATLCLVGFVLLSNFIEAKPAPAENVHHHKTGGSSHHHKTGGSKHSHHYSTGGGAGAGGSGGGDAGAGGSGGGDAGAGGSGGGDVGLGGSGGGGAGKPHKHHYSTGGGAGGSGDGTGGLGGDAGGSGGLGGGLGGNINLNGNLGLGGSGGGGGGLNLKGGLTGNLGLNGGGGLTGNLGLNGGGGLSGDLGGSGGGDADGPNEGGTGDLFAALGNLPGISASTITTFRHLLDKAGIDLSNVNVADLNLGNLGGHLGGNIGGEPCPDGRGVDKLDGKDSLQPSVCYDKCNDRYGVGKHFVRGVRDVGNAILSEAETILSPLTFGLAGGLGEGLKVVLCHIEDGFSDFGSDFDSATDIAKHGLVNFFKLQGPHPVLGIPVGIAGIAAEAGKAAVSIVGDLLGGITGGFGALATAL